MMDTPSVQEMAKVLVKHLNTCPVPDRLRGSREERPFRRWVGERARDWVDANHRDTFTVKIEPDEGGVYPVKMFKTSFWPDVSVESPDSRAFLAVEVKCLRRRGLPGHVAQALGQALLYRDPYQHSIVVFVLVEPLDSAVLADIADKLDGFGITVAMVEAFA